MPVAHINRENIALFKRCLRTIWPSLGSSHADEAIAAHCGYRTYAALLAALPVGEDTLEAQTDPAALMERLSSLGYRFPATDLERVLRLFQAELMGRSSENFRRMAARTANDNRP
jgi:hypothetical protein